MDGSISLDPLSAGRAWYQNKNYALALTAFTQAIEDHTGFMEMKALDNRAATYEKLGQLNNAVKDAYSMIRLSPDKSKGYLRCGKVLQLKGEAELALKIYDRGLSKVKVGNDEDRILLQGMFSKLQKKLTPPEPKYYDPLVKLPLELARMVCAYMDMRDRVVCLCVSSPWKRFLESSHDLWNEIDLFRIRKPLGQKSLRAHCLRSNYMLTKAMINVAHFDSSKLNYLLRTCKQLQHLEFRQGYLGDSLTAALPYAGNLRTLRLWDDVEIPFLSVVKVLMARPELEVAEFKRIQLGRLGIPVIPQLRALNCLTLGPPSMMGESNMAPNVNVLDLGALKKQAPNLKKLTIRQWMILNGDRFPEWTELEFLNVSQSKGFSIFNLPSSLVHLDCSRTVMDSNHLDFLSPGAVPTPTRLPLIETLNCEGMQCDGHPSWQILDVIMSMLEPSIEAGKLKSLNLGHCGLDDNISPYKFSACDSLVELSLKDLDVSEPTLTEIVRKYPNVRRLDLSGTKVTGVLVKEVVTRGQEPLQFLGLVNATKTSLDAVVWARNLGTIVQTSAGSVTFKKHFRDRVWD